MTILQNTPFVAIMKRKALRKRAEDVVRARDKESGVRATHDLQRVVQELQVHRIELEMQNEELRSARIEAERAREQYFELFEAAPSGYLMLDHERRITECNQAASRMLRLPKQRLVGQLLDRLVSEVDRSRLLTHLQSAAGSGRADCEMQLWAADGGLRVRLDTSPIPSRSAGDCLIVLTDMTERQRDHDALEQLNRELERRVSERTSELSAQNRQLAAEIEARATGEARHRELEARLREAERLQSLGMLAAGVAHDFNNLLVPVVGNAEMLQLMPNLPDACREPLACIQRTGQDAAELTRQLLVFAGLGKMETTAVAVPELLSACLELLRPRFGANIRVETQFASTDAITADRTQVQRVLMNLLTNSIEALEGGGQIVVGTRAVQLDADALAQFQHAATARPGAFVIVHVSDTGRGIDPTSAMRIFEPFFSTKFTGRGLGLATVLGIVHSHAGALRVQSGPDKGTRFEIAFPQAEIARPSNPAGMQAKETWRGGGSVLLIDDDSAVRQVVAQLLRALGFQVTAANGGQAGLAFLERDDARYDLVVLDWLMPILSGADVLRELRRRDPVLPVILMSGYSPDSLTSSSDEHVTRIQKPMTIAQLQAAVRNVSEHLGRGAAPTLECRPTGV